MAQQRQDAPGGSLRARRYAIKLSPPSIFLEYEDPDGKRRVRAVKLVNITPSTDVDRLTRKVIRSFPRRLDTASVKYEQVRKLVFRLVEAVRLQQQPQHVSAPGQLSLQLTGSSTSDAAAHVHQQALQHPGGARLESTLPPPVVSPKLGNPKLARVQHLGAGAGGRLGAEELRHSSESRFSTSTDGGVGVHTDDEDEPLTSLANGSHAAAAHGAQGPGGTAIGKETLELDDMLIELDRELGGGGLQAGRATGLGDMYHSDDFLVEAARTSAPGTHHLPSRLSGSGNKRDSSGSNPSRLAPAATPPLGDGRPVYEQQQWQGSTSVAANANSDDSDDDGALVLDMDFPEDLNKVSEVKLQLAKMHMEQDFQRNQVKPGHKDYEYDKQVEFAPPTETNDWDED